MAIVDSSKSDRKTSLELQLMDMLKPNGISKAVRLTSIDIETETLISPAKLEKIIQLLKAGYDKFETTKSLELIPYGSRCYGLGESSSDFNIFVDRRTR